MSDNAEDQRRQQEISMFAAMALGEDAAHSRSANPDASAFGSVNFTKKDEIALKPKKRAGDSREAFTKAVQQEDTIDSGTFSFHSSAEAAPSTNLQAALAALEAEEPATGSAKKAQFALQAPPVGHEKPPPVDPSAGPMFLQQVKMERPLFFGAIVPPRVVRQARSMVVEAYQQLSYEPGVSDPSLRPPLSQLPPSVRNVVGALRTHGYGIDVLGDEDLVQTHPTSYWKGPHAEVTTYQPVWGEAERAARIAAARKHRRPAAVSRACTAPASLASPTAAAANHFSEAGQSTEEEVVGGLRQTQNELFSQWVRADDDSVTSPLAAIGPDSLASSMTVGPDSLASSMGSIRSFDASVKDLATLPTTDNESESKTLESVPSVALSEQELFSQWARGGAGDTLVTESNTSAGSSSGAPALGFDSSTFQLRAPPVVVDSDDDSVDYDEQKKKVGVSDHLSKALASLSDQSVPDEPELMTHVLLSQIPTDGSQRPLTNYEVTDGCVPQFGVDDPPLPVESDLGIHETKEEQQRYTEIKRSQEIVEKFVAPNVFGSIACPNPALNPDDFHSWHTRATGNRRLPRAGTVESLSLPSFNQRSRAETGNKKNGKRYHSRTRYGWWNVGDEQDWPASVSKAKEAEKGKENGENDAVPSPTAAVAEERKSMRQFPPAHHSATALQAVTALEPTPGQLQKENLPLSRMDAATSAAQTLPYLSDRPPSYRYLQIETKAVGFPPVGGEIEPFFCSLAIYNVETVSSNGTSTSENSAAPVPDLQRCGRVTESLHFDVVRDPEIVQNCVAALWPGRADSPFAKILSGGSEPSADQSEGTRCGVFPLPSNFSFSNLYAVLIVHKVLSDDTLEMYLKPGAVASDLGKLRASAVKTSQRQAPFLLPFAFGVAPLLQVFEGAENPVLTSSRAVQIPLFRFSPGLGERQIIDHIMVMLNPRAGHRAAGVGGPAAATNGGTAMLVMRSFGFLGLHQVVNNASNLARDRLVDFTGELQLRRNEEELEENDRKPKYEGFSCRLPPWCPDFLAEPTTAGGRTTTNSTPSNPKESHRYAQELAPRSLQARMTSPVQPGANRGRLHGQDIEPFYHTTFCNEMLLHPRLLHNCPKGNIVVKTELREIEWNAASSAYFAHLPQVGPALHNNRRGPFLVQSLFTSCSPRGSNKHFMDEFKMKLPLDLRPGNKFGTGRRVLSLFFTVYNIKLSRSKWKISKMFSSVDGGAAATKEEGGGSLRMDQIACGFLPISADTCLIDDGMHDVRIMYTSRPAPPEMIQQRKAAITSLVLRERTESSDHASSAGKEHSTAEDTTVSNDSAADMTKTDHSTASASDLVSATDDSLSKSDRQKDGSEPISLSVRITVHSSVHAQNDALADMLELVHDSPRDGKRMDAVFLSKLRMGRDFLTSNIETIGARRPSSLEVKLFESVLNIVKSQVCPITHSYGHVIRIIPTLWRTLLCGAGEPDLTWANPAAPIPLRLHTFATILQLLGGVSLYLQKNGVMQVDGVTKWNIVALARVVALLFDEGSLFGKQSTEAFDKEKWAREFEDPSESDKIPTPASNNQSSVQRRKRHVRNNLEILDILLPPKAGNNKGKSNTDQKSSLYASAVDDSVIKTRSAATLSSHSATKKMDLKLDSKSDFQSALRAAAAAEDDFDHIETDGAKTAKAMIQAFGGASGSRRWMTAPVRALSTISEAEDGDDLDGAMEAAAQSASPSPLVPITEVGKEQLDTTIRRAAPKRAVKQMRIPKSLKKQGEENTPVERPSAITSETRQTSLPRTDREIESAGTAFLDVIGKELGISAGARMLASEEQRVGSSHHRKSRSNSSIDWTLLGDGLLSSNFESPGLASKVEADEDDQSELFSALKHEESNSVRFPDFVERLMNAGRASEKEARWCPFAYEVIILQWAAILTAQRAAGETSRTDASQKSSSGQTSEGESSVNQSVAQAAARSIGVAVAAAPLLFEIIKQSLGFRIHSLYEEVLKDNPSVDCPPLMTLDESLQTALEEVVSMVADACIDSRNFDTWELRQMSINVNDSIVRFLRDLFSLLSPASNHRLVLSYLSRFVTREGKHWQDRDSSIGLRCSWEITKLRLNAITGLIRFPDFVRINSPQMLNWTKWWLPSSARPDTFFTGILDHYRKYRLSRFVGRENEPSEDISIPPLRPHWLAEIVTDICLIGTQHAEPQIQQRSAALLHEMFWTSSQDGILAGTNAPVASMYLTFLEKMLQQVNFMSNFAPKSQLRKDLLPCVVFVLQSAPASLLRALWRWLCEGLPGQSLSKQYGGFLRTEGDEKESNGPPKMSRANEARPDVLDMFKLLNLSLRTMEYEGCDENLEGEVGTSSDSIDQWRREFLLSAEDSFTSDSRGRRRRAPSRGGGKPRETCTSSISRRWHAHDGSLVIINAGHQLVFEMYAMLHVIPDGDSFLNPAVGNKSHSRIDSEVSESLRRLTKEDVVLFVRGATSLYLHALALRESDIVSIRAFKVTAEIIKIFGIKTFLEAVGETLQHWMRVISLHCGARRANVRIEATDLLELILRSTWECYGSFFRIRVPLLAVQTEVMERIVATAATRYYRDQRKLDTKLEPFTNVSAEASLVPLWRTLDRIEKQPASQNVAFRGALVRMSRKLKMLYRAYIAARVLSFIQGSRSSSSSDDVRPILDNGTEALIRANRISILRVINASEGHSKQFLGFHATTQQRSRVAHYEAVEDALIDAADVFSPTELPEHRVAWLRMLADFHASRKRFAEEATCHFQINVTLQQAARLHGSLWSNTPFLPWTDNMPDPVYIDGDSPTADPDFISEYGLEDVDSQYANINSFRRIFYRVANSVAIAQDDWDTSGRQNLFCGISSLSEYFSVSPWLSLRDMEEEMVEEAEAAGDLFLSAGIIESSRFAWRLATEYYSQRFNYSKLAIAYSNLARTVVSKVPQIDASLPQEVSAILGRFYRVWFHGGAPDELNGIEFIYRAEGTVRLDQFGQELRDVVKSIIPAKTPIHLVLDGRTETKLEDGAMNFGYNRLGPTPLEPVRIKVTPLRPLFGQSTRVRGMPEWFYRYADEAFSDLNHRRTNDFGRSMSRNATNPGHSSDVADPHLQREHTRSYSASVFSSMGNSAGGAAMGRVGLGDERASRFSSPGDSELSGVDKFCFVQPKDRSRGKDWWKYTSGDFAQKSLKVTQLQVAQDFPACVARQPVVHRLVYSQSPLEAGIDAVCQWCAVLFRTAVATIGMAVLGSNLDPGIGTEAVKVVVDSIHSSHVKEIGLSLLIKLSNPEERDTMSEFSLESYDRLSDPEIEKLQMKLARLVVVFFELLHLLITRNRQRLLDVMQERKKADPIPTSTSMKNQSRATSVGPGTAGENHSHLRNQSNRSTGSNEVSIEFSQSQHGRRTTTQPDTRSLYDEVRSDGGHHRTRSQARSDPEDQTVQSMGTHANIGSEKRTGSAIAVQGELQRAFINMAKALYPKIQTVMRNDMPKWFKQCASDSYFSLGTYKQTKIPIAEELGFTPESMIPHSNSTGLLGQAGNHYDRGLDSPRGSAGGSSHSVVSRGSERFGYAQF